MGGFILFSEFFFSSLLGEDDRAEDFPVNGDGGVVSLFSVVTLLLESQNIASFMTALSV